MSRVSGYPSRPPSRPPSEQLCDLHVYKVPWELWRAPLNNILNQSVTDTISLGIIRVNPDTPLIDIRGEIARQLEELAPRDYVFLRSVGRSITRLKNKQEYQLKAKHFLPPVHYAPELFLLEGTADNIAAISDRSSQQSPTSLHRGSPGGRSYREGYNRPYRDRNGYADHIVPTRRGSPDPSPSRKAAAGPFHRGANGYRGYDDDDHDGGGDVAGTSPEEQYNKDRKKDRDKENFYDALDSKTRDLNNRLDRDRLNGDEDDDDARRRLQDMEEGAEMDRERWASEQEERRRRAEAERRRAEEERKKAEEEEKKRRQQEREDEERKRRQLEREGEERKRRQLEQEEEEERRKREEAARLKDDEGLNRFPSPPPLHMSSPDVVRDSESARQRRKEEQKRLLEELEQARSTRQHTEREREELVKKAKNLQNKTQNRRNQARDIWKKRYFDEKKKTPPLEEQTNRLQEELEALHRKLMAALEGPKEKNLKLGDNRPSQKNNYVIQCTKLQHDIDDLKRRVENAKMKLTAEMKLRNQAEMELRALRAELVQKKISLSLSRSQQFAALNPSMPMPAIEAGKGTGEMQIAAA